jgi:hypothetical protein
MGICVNPVLNGSGTSHVLSASPGAAGGVIRIESRLSWVEQVRGQGEESIGHVVRLRNIQVLASGHLGIGSPFRRTS